jgi:hypothetical protein
MIDLVNSSRELFKSSFAVRYKRSLLEYLELSLRSDRQHFDQYFDSDKTGSDSDLAAK